MGAAGIKTFSENIKEYLLIHPADPALLWGACSGHRDHDELLEAVEFVVAVALRDAGGHVLGDAGADGGADEAAGQAQVQLLERVAPRPAHAAMVRSLPVLTGMQRVTEGVKCCQDRN